LGEIPLDFNYTDGKQASLGKERFVGTFVDIQRAMGVGGMEEPKVAVSNRLG
jgi:hypothetical protein